MKKKKVVYSTRSGDLRGQSDASSGPSRSLPPAQQDLRIRRETKGRGGKTVTVISGFVLTDSDLKALAKTLKSSCGAGGTTKLEDDTQIIEIQGDHRDTVAEKLKELGYKAKLAGG
jgi:translation initiation factor 1